MYVKGTDNTLLNLTTAASPKLRNGWQAGQLLKAMVVNTDRQGGATLEINGQRLQAQAQNQASMPLKAGQNLQLEVVRGGSNPVLKLLNPPANQQEVVSRGVRQSLPQQQPLPQLLNALNQLAHTSKGETSQQLKALSQQILNQLPQLQQLKTGPDLKRALQDSGSFLESKLKQMAQPGQTEKGSAELSRDLKAGVLRLLQQLRNMPQTQNQTQTQGSTARGATQTGVAPQPQSQAPGNPATAQTEMLAAKPSTAAASRAVVYSNNQPPPAAQSQQTGAQGLPSVQMLGARPAGETQQQLESGLARIQFNQLQSIQQSEGQQRPSWLLELPVRQPDGQINTLQLEIQRDRDEDSKTQKPAIWTVSLGFELQKLGAVRAGLTLVGENQMGVSLWADEANTVELFDRNKAILQQGMEKAGLQVTRVGCQQGRPPQPKAEAVFSQQGLVDEQA